MTTGPADGLDLKGPTNRADEYFVSRPTSPASDRPAPDHPTVVR